MTEKIQKAIDKIDQEAEKMGSATVRLLCSHIIDHCLVNDENADKERWDITFFRSGVRRL